MTRDYNTGVRIAVDSKCCIACSAGEPPTRIIPLQGSIALQLQWPRINHDARFIPATYYVR